MNQSSCSPLQPARIVTRTRVTKVDGEYIVKAYDQHGQRYAEADYYTNDKTDAQQVALCMVYRGR